MRCGCHYTKNKWHLCDQAKKLWIEYKKDINNNKKRKDYDRHFNTQQ